MAACKHWRKAEHHGLRELGSKGYVSTTRREATNSSNDPRADKKSKNIVPQDIDGSTWEASRSDFTRESVECVSSWLVLRDVSKGVRRLVGAVVSRFAKESRSKTRRETTYTRFTLRAYIPRVSSATSSISAATTCSQLSEPEMYLATLTFFSSPQIRDQSQYILMARYGKS